MNRDFSAPIYMVKKTADGLTVFFRAGRRRGIRPGDRLAVLNEEGLPVGEIRVRSCSEEDAEGAALGEVAIGMGCRVELSRSSA